MKQQEMIEILVESMRTIAESATGSLRRAFTFTGIDGYKFVYTPYWAEDEYVPSNLTTFIIKAKGKLFNNTLLKLEYDDKSFFGTTANHKSELNLKNRSLATLALDKLHKWIKDNTIDEEQE